VILANDATTIGRLAECDVVVADRGASRRHAQIRRHDGTFTVTDLGSTNGTRLNGQTIQSRELADGDRITIGATTIEFRRGGA
jgi:pSer/pThr/pTyr-binding forkhead associated (FHA) protein